MPACKECKWFFPLEDDPEKGDCIRRETDPKQSYWTAKPKKAADDASKCPDFETK